MSTQRIGEHVDTVQIKVADVLVELGEDADCQEVAQAVQHRFQIELTPAMVESIRATLRERTQIPPGPDQPPPEAALGPRREA